MYAGHPFDLDGDLISQSDWDAKAAGEWLPTIADREYVQSLMKPSLEAGKYAGWIAPPAKGINGKEIDFEYVKL